MNKGRFRLVFSAVRGMLVAVEEYARGYGDGAAARSSTLPQANADTASIWFAARALAFAALCAFGIQPLQVEAQATLPVTPDKSGPHPVVGVAGNGVPVVNIVAPMARASRITGSRSTTSARRGWYSITAVRPTRRKSRVTYKAIRFSVTAARATILNEVTAANPSRLLGMTEVAGNRANVILANPAGITCNGCGFINAPRVTLTTGVPVLDGSGALSSLRRDAKRDHHRRARLGCSRNESG